ncbi:TolC family protein [Segetibacter sp. 3557_3]|uniref:TolC family protein n=1 Tax=Segetibacter sp. 3557_3 TaxID=2547429 RepID=UPI0010587C68|nr:TolC family protein [Segetibacter sp. 3557_3]TDH27003.1 TolC family protein [Segetibacter sp. 3557_3]
MRLKHACFVLLLLCVQVVYGQTEQTNILTLDQFITRVKQFHPVAKQAAIQVDKGMAELMAARGGFDPTVSFEASRKTFAGTNYYQYNIAEFGIPLPVGNLKTGIQNNGGNYLTTEETKGRASYLGYELPLGKGLLIDNRRAVLQQARIYRDQTEQERRLIINNLLYDAYSTYWQWAGAWQQYAIMSGFVNVAERRLRLMRISFQNGDRAQMDTTEAFAQFQQYQMILESTRLAWNNASLELANFLWQQNEEPLDLPEQTLPENREANAAPLLQIQALLNESSVLNPGLRIYGYKINSLEIERRLKFQSMLPYFSVKANLLSKDYYALKNMSTAYIGNNYNWGVDFRIPIFLREARGDYRQAQLKVREANLELIDKRLQLKNKVQSYYNEYVTISSQLRIIENMYASYQSLLRNEELKFSQGESSLFLVNSREIKVIETLQKKIDLSIKLNKARYAVEWSAGLLQ